MTVSAVARCARRAGWLVAGLLACSASSALQVKERFVTERDGELTYRADERGNRFPDFSTAGYGGGGVPLPDVPVRVVVPPVEGDDGARIQAALDQVAQRTPDAQGLRGAVYLPAGRYEIAGQLTLRASGVVLRGAGAGKDGTVLVATGTDRRTLIEIAGFADRRPVGEPRAVTDSYVPAGSNRIEVSSTAGLAAGSRVRIERPCTTEWLDAVGMHEAPARTTYRWRPGEIVVAWDRIVTAVEGNRIVLDASLTTALDPAFGGATATAYTWPGRISQVGIEHLRCVSEFAAANPLDEEHAWMAVTLDAVEDAWVSNVTAVHFVSSAVQVGPGARAVTVQDCASLAPVSELAGYRRHSFHGSGELTLFLRCRAEQGRHDFTVGHLAAGPNVFLDCEAVDAHGFSGSIGSWASGALFDNVTIDGGGLHLDNLEVWNQGVGWAAANSVLWQCSAPLMTVRRPPTANNWAVGVWGQFQGDGWWDQVDTFARPESLYRAQLRQRTGGEGLAALEPRAPAVPPADRLTALRFDGVIPPAPARSSNPLALASGWLANGATGGIQPGRETAITWWRGSMLPTRAAQFGINVTRFAPGRTGPGATDDLDELTDTMAREGRRVLRHHYGLWHDRRRDDHLRMRRADADVWPPFYEQPWARSGQGRAWHGLSRYDLTKWNPWYFGRLRTFAGLAREKGLVLVNEMYFQHNILETGAHWVDSPWRPVNALQPTGFTEPPPFTGDTIKMADEFYDVTHPVRRELHRAYIRQCLANLSDQPNVVHTTSAEFTGPLHFVEFWLDVIAEWEAGTGMRPLIALSTTKDVQDAILADPRRSAVVDVIDFTYWWRHARGEFAPGGGLNLAPRQHQRKSGGGAPTATTLAGMAREYRERFPDKAVMTGLNQPDPWAWLAAGGSLPALPAGTDADLLAAVARMRPLASTGEDQWALAASGEGAFAVALAGQPVRLDLRGEHGRFRVQRIDPATGAVTDTGTTVEAGRVVELPGAGRGTTVAWLRR